jgi:hypothetical protein
VVTVAVTRIICALLAIPAFFACGAGADVQAIAPIIIGLATVSTALILRTHRTVAAAH